MSQLTIPTTAAEFEANRRLCLPDDPEALFLFRIDPLLARALDQAVREATSTEAALWSVIEALSKDRLRMIADRTAAMCFSVTGWRM